MDALRAAEAARAEKVVAQRNFKPLGTRCREYEALYPEETDSCPTYGSHSVFTVDLVNEICEQLARTGAEADFVDPVEAVADLQASSRIDPKGCFTGE